MTSLRSFFVVTALASACTAALAAPSLPSPDGGYPVGVVRTEFADPTRLLDAADPDSGPRRLPAVVWYPAVESALVDGAAYLAPEAVTATVPAISRLFRYPLPEVETLVDVRIAAGLHARPATQTGGFPVVVYSHGLFLYPEQNTALAMLLASHGYIVVSIAHPGDSADLRLRDGRLVATAPFGPGAADARFTAAWEVLMGADGLAARREALETYASAQSSTHIGLAAVRWREDTEAVAAAIVDGATPADLHDILAAADRNRLAFAGMSFGGAASAAGCRRVAACRAAVNLDGQNLEADVYDSPIGRPLLLVLSDWSRYGLFEGQPRETDYSPNDLAYERWREAGTTADVVRLRLRGIRHMGLTDFHALLPASMRDERFGDIAPEAAASAIGDVVLAFLDAYVQGADVTGLDHAIDRHPALVRHVPTRLQRWAEVEATREQPGTAPSSAR
ncbi:hypothetical protein [Luteimonas fraxinea]|uniref:alpha/beta hydrolase n=1 Tax=Luteimonas fraxinea TaxID=2901869 RepID=UPI001E4534ED|nr:hypothetical protein [Luteimonas fraxinea]MCD9125810.1 hypothetical protein [Luteimonas fraxinea]